MMFLVIASAFLVTVYGQDPNPTKVCLPDVLQLNIAAQTESGSGVFAFNFLEKAIAWRLNSGSRAVFNLTSSTVTYVNPPDSSCFKFPFEEFETIRFGILSQCFSVGAKLLTPANTHLGLSPASLDIQAWEITAGHTGSARVALTNSSPAVPIIVQSVYNRPPAVSGPSTNDIQFLVNAKTSIDDLTIFDVPAHCPEAGR